MSDGYQMTDAIEVPGGTVEAGHEGADVVVHVHGGRQVRLAREGRERFQRAFMESERQIEAEAGNHDQDC